MQCLVVNSKISPTFGDSITLPHNYNDNNYNNDDNDNYDSGHAEFLLSSNLLCPLYFGCPAVCDELIIEPGWNFCRVKLWLKR